MGLKRMKEKEAGQLLQRDISELKRSEEEKARIEDRRILEMKMDAIGRLAAGVAHDFNNILTVIAGYCGILLHKVGKESPLYGEVSEIKRAGERGARLTRQLMVFSRKQIIDPKTLDLNALIAGLHKMLAQLIGGNIELAVAPGEGLSMVKVDPVQFEQILVNLASNAREAMPDGGKLKIETSNVEPDEAYRAADPGVTPGRFVLLTVSDTGHGMTDEVKARIFEPFFTTKPTGIGTGMGLSMTYGAVKHAGGAIEVSSEVGKGTTVRISLPRVIPAIPSPSSNGLP